MAPPRTFNYDVLNQIIRDNPEWSNQELADVITQYERAARRDPRYPPIKPNAIARAKSTMRPTWEHEGRPIPDRAYGRLIPWPGIPQQFIMDTKLRHLRTLKRIELGEQLTPRQRRQALAYKAHLLGKGLVVDITDEGEPYERLATSKEAGQLMAEVRPEWLAQVTGAVPLSMDYLKGLMQRHAS